MIHNIYLGKDKHFLKDTNCDNFGTKLKLILAKVCYKTSSIVRVRFGLHWGQILKLSLLLIFFFNSVDIYITRTL